MRSLPLFHRISGQPVIVLGEGPMAEPKKRLVERAGGEVIDEIAEGIDRGARLAFIAYEDESACETAMLRLRGTGLLVNVVDKPEWCDFTTPSLLERDPVLIAIGTSGASAGLAKHLRLRLEALLPQRLGELALKLAEMRGVLRKRWPGAGERRLALDAALGEGGVLDPLDEASAERVESWLADADGPQAHSQHSFTIASDDPEDLTLRQARLLGRADAVLYEPGIAPAILLRARADAMRIPLPTDEAPMTGLVVTLQRA